MPVGYDYLRAAPSVLVHLPSASPFAHTIANWDSFPALFLCFCSASTCTGFKCSHTCIICTTCRDCPGGDCAYARVQPNILCMSVCPRVDVHVRINCIYPRTHIKYLIPSAWLRLILYGFTSIVCSPTHRPTDQCSSIIGKCVHART